MSSDFAVIAADFTTIEDAVARSAALAAAAPSTAVPSTAAAGSGLAAFSTDLHSAHLCGQEAFLSADPYCAPGGIILRTRTRDIDRTIASLMLMTKDRGLAVIDLDRSCVYDPRGRVDLHAYTGSGLHLPYVTEALLAQVLAHQDFYGEFLLIQRTPQHYIHALCPPDAAQVVEYRVGDTAHHYRLVTEDRTVVVPLLWGWTRDGPACDAITERHWRPLAS